MTALTWATALSWRLGRQLLDPVGTGSAADVVRTLGAVPAWPDTTQELAVGVRRASGVLGDAAAALATGEVVKVYAFRGGTHLMTPQDAGAYLALRASSRMWERPSWQSYYELAPSDWPRFREAVRQTLSGGALTRSQLVDALARLPRYARVATVIGEGNETVLKPLSWQGELALGPTSDGEPTFLSPYDVSGWAGVPDPDQAGPRVIEHYFRTFGPASAERVHEWFGKGLGAKRRDLTRWLGLLESRLETVIVDGEETLMLREDVDDLAQTPASQTVQLLPARDPWVMVPGSSDARVVPAAHKDIVSRYANLVVHRGVVAGTWSMRGGTLGVEWFPESGPVPSEDLHEQAAALLRLLGAGADPHEIAVTAG